jgi:molecular chaperone DnaK
MSKRAIGIDLGSTASECAVIEQGKPVVVFNEEGSNMTPSVVSFVNDERKVGGPAKRKMIVNPKETVNLIKRFMGATYEESKEAMTHVLYDVVEKNGQPRVKVGERFYSPEEISAMIIGSLKKNAESYLGDEVTEAVITVPAFFSDSARAATKKAGEMAGLNVLRVIAEPTAAILSSNIDMEKGGKYMVVDFGGSTLDDSVADISDGVVEILSTNGDVYLGGSDLDKAIAEHIVKTYKEDSGIDIKDDAQAMSRVMDAAEKAKIDLSSSSMADINIPYITVKDNQPQHLMMQLSRSKFEQIISPFVDKLINCAKKAIELANIEKKDLNGILLVCGSCRIPLVQERLTKEFGIELIKSSNLDLAVAEGAAIQANILVGGENAKDILLLDCTPMNYSIETEGGIATTLIEANTTIPCEKRQVFSTAVDNQPAVNIHVLNGLRPMAKDNKSIGLFRLDGIMPARRGVPQIEVTFDISADGILKVSAVDKATNKEQSITIEQSGSLSKEEIERIKKEAEQFAEADKKEREIADTINKGDSIVFSSEKMLEEQGDKMPEDKRTEMQSLLDEMKTAVKDKKADDINSLEEKINKIWNEVASAMYASQAQEQATQSANPTEEANGENVQNADFEEIN